jgi:rubrerythrin
MSECKHEKVYSNAYLTSNPPKRKWICRKCGYIEFETIQMPKEPEESFEKIAERFHGKNKK